MKVNQTKFKKFFFSFCVFAFAFFSTYNVFSQTTFSQITQVENYIINNPTINAPTPPARETLDVISIFSDSYNNIAGANYNPDWQQSGFGSANTAFQPTGSGNAVLAYTNFN